MRRFAGISIILFLLPACLVAQVDDAKDAISRGEYPRAITLLTAALAQNPTADTYLYLGIAYGHVRDYARSETILKEGATRFDRDPRFHDELAGVHLARNQVDQARSALRTALAIDPNDKYASDLLGNIDLSRGNVRSALAYWNLSGRPVVGEILHNGYPSPGNWTIKKAPAFHSGDLLRYDAWRTTQRRLMETGVFSNADLEIEPTKDPDRYNINIRTLPKTNTKEAFLFDLLKGVFVDTTYVDVWNLRNTGIGLRSKFRWNPDRRLGEARILAPLPFPGILLLDASATWRSEQWSIDTVTRQPDVRDRFRFKSTGGRLLLKRIVNSYLEFGGGVEYRNRIADGGRPELSIDSRNTGKLLAESSVYLAESQIRLHGEGFLARKSLLGDLDYSGGTLEVNSRTNLETRGMYAFVTLKGGTARGSVPIDDYFTLGADTHSRNLLRGHSMTYHGRPGTAPMGTDFALANFSLEGQIQTLPTLNAFNLPYINVKAEVFVDVGKAFDRARVFRQDKLLVDFGGGFKFETPTHAFHILYGYAIREGHGNLMAYVEKRWW